MEILLETPCKTDTAWRKEEETYLSISLSLRQKLCTMGGEVPYVANTGLKRERGERKLRFFSEPLFRGLFRELVVFDPMTDTMDRNGAKTKTKTANRLVAQTAIFQRQK